MLRGRPHSSVSGYSRLSRTLKQDAPLNRYVLPSAPVRTASSPVRNLSGTVRSVRGRNGVALTARPSSEERRIQPSGPGDRVDDVAPERVDRPRVPVVDLGIVAARVAHVPVTGEEVGAAVLPDEGGVDPVERDAVPVLAQALRLGPPAVPGVEG